MHEFKKSGNNDITTAYANAVITSGENSNMKVLSVDEWENEVAKGMSSNGSGFMTRAAYYSDEILPFDITISMQNEYGQASTFSILGVELLNEGSGFSIDDITSEKACTFVARDITPMKVVSVSGATSSIIQSARN